MPIISGSGSSSSAGRELNYTQITAAVNVVSTTEATGTTIISPGAVTFDGTPVLLQVYAYQVWTPTDATTSFLVISLFEGATQITRLGYFPSVTTAPQFIYTPGTLSYRFTPTAAAHTYLITAHVSSTSGTPRVAAGAGGTGLGNPSFARFTKA